MNSSIGIADSTSTLIEQDINSFITMIRLYCIQTKQLQEMQIFLSANEHQLSLLNTSSTANNAPSPTPVTSSVSEPIVTPSAFVSLPHNSSNSHLSSQSMMMPQMLANSNNKINKSINLAELFGHQATISDQEKQQGLPQKSKKSTPPAFGQLEDSAILHVNTQLAPRHQPILMTPDAFISSPNALNKQRFSASGTLDLSNADTLNNESLETKPVTSIDLLQTLINNHNSQSVTVSQSLNLTSSRASSLTQVTAPTNTIAPTATSLLPANNKPKQLNKKSNKIRSNRSTTQSSSTSTDNSDTSESSSSEFDAEDQEIALLSSKAAGVAARNGKKSGRNGQQPQAKQYQILKRVRFIILNFT